MAEVTYFVALPFVAADDGIAAGEPIESHGGGNESGSAVAQGRPYRRRGLQSNRRSCDGRIRRCEGDQEVWRGAGRSRYFVR